MNNPFNKLIDSVIFVTFLQLVLAPQAFAYIDLGTGSYLIQMLMAGFLGSLFVIKATWRNIRSYMGRWFSRNASDKDAHD